MALDGKIVEEASKKGKASFLKTDVSSILQKVVPATKWFESHYVGIGASNKKVAEEKEKNAQLLKAVTDESLQPIASQSQSQSTE